MVTSPSLWGVSCSTSAVQSSASALSGCVAQYLRSSWSRTIHCSPPEALQQHTAKLRELDQQILNENTHNIEVLVLTESARCVNVTASPDSTVRVQELADCLNVGQITLASAELPMGETLHSQGITNETKLRVVDVGVSLNQITVPS